MRYYKKYIYVIFKTVVLLFFNCTLGYSFINKALKWPTIVAFTPYYLILFTDLLGYFSLFTFINIKKEYSVQALNKN